MFLIFVFEHVSLGIVLPLNLSLIKIANCVGIHALKKQAKMVHFFKSKVQTCFFLNIFNSLLTILLKTLKITLKTRLLVKIQSYFKSTHLEINKYNQRLKETV